VPSILRLLTVAGRVLHAGEVEDRGTNVHYAGKSADELAALPLFCEPGVMNDCAQDVSFCPFRFLGKDDFIWEWTLT
jgi:hypothetical protein